MAIAGILYTTIAILNGEWVYATAGIGLIAVSTKFYLVVTSTPQIQ